MSSWLDKAEPWLEPAAEVDPSEPGEVSPAHIYRGAECLSESMDVWFWEFMRRVTGFDTNNQIWPFMKYSESQYLDGSFSKYQWILDYKGDRKNNGDTPSVPRSVACIANMPKMREDCLLAQEVAAIFHLTFHRFLTARKKGFHVVPVTLISCSGNKVRVLHAYIDEANRCVNVRKSPIFDFAGGIKKPDKTPEYKNWVRILCWVLAKPDVDSVRDLEKRLASGGDDKRGERDREQEGSSLQPRNINTQRGGYGDQRCNPAPPVQRPTVSASQGPNLHPASAQHAKPLVSQGKPPVPE
ncbi:hypothetical protein MAPG_01915 [Magnaporthiopsis poae ATCC 64411]|uniref:Uncharacterized protein n=1 Tax=Magnaporthiopsis poae (strain ATCC 64411 / 73-15) TaxID=644358 RepID=A0A0C4DPY4_MAGP6|nr:hypothetical protein MAPG_01915 [Magnaporthiopsis poae ATCC 64411]